MQSVEYLGKCKGKKKTLELMVFLAMCEEL